MADLSSGSKPTAVRVTHIPNGTDPDRPRLEMWFISVVHARHTEIIASCDHPQHAAAVSSALAIAYGVPVIGDEPPLPRPPVPRPPAGLPPRRPGQIMPR